MSDSLKHTSTLPPEGFTKDQCKNDLSSLRDELFELQNVFYADGRYGLLIVIQGMDSSGKDGIIRHVMTAMNPMGLQVKAFKKPTEEELKHDFLWRVYPHLPERGMIQVFNRSYYEDLIVPEIMNSLPEDRIKHRWKLIKELEDHLERNNIHVLKFFLHISKEEQMDRIKERLTLPRKRWKYTDADMVAANKWDEYAELYSSLLVENDQIPWHVIPADKRWYRNYAVAKVVTDHFKKLDVKYPELKV